MVTKLLLGTGNKTKLDIYKDYLKDLPLEIVTPQDLGILDEPEETGQTLEENAILKARYYHERSGLPTLADDAGFEIPALNNFPGVYSRRFAGSNASDEDRVNAIIEKMADLKGDERKAQMSVVCALALDANRIYTASGKIEGHVPEIPFEKRTPHMPYRSLLFVDSLNQWFDDAMSENSISYRKSAVMELKKYLIIS